MPALVVEAERFRHKVGAGGHEMTQEMSNAWRLWVDRPRYLITNTNDAAGVRPPALQNNFFVWRAHATILGSLLLLRKLRNGCFLVYESVVPEVSE